nr:hypothetical protein [Mycoplasmopsis bovis]
MLSGSFDEQAEKLKEIFKKANENKNEDYRDQEVNLRKEISETLRENIKRSYYSF